MTETDGFVQFGDGFAQLRVFFVLNLLVPYSSNKKRFLCILIHNDINDVTGLKVLLDQLMKLI